jgi:beta-glucuronidase
MLYPQTNPQRQRVDLSGFWDFCFDADDAGRDRGWMDGLPSSRPVAVPASWNDQFAEDRDNLGPAWYQTRFYAPRSPEPQRIYLRFNSVNYAAQVWLNGQPLGENKGGHLPFTFDITESVKPGENLLVVRVDGRLAPDQVPPGNVPPDPLDTFANAAYPAANFDFFPFCGIQRPVLCYTTPVDAIADLHVITGIEGSAGVVQVRLARTSDKAAQARFVLSGHGQQVVEEVEALRRDTEATLRIPDARFWAPGSPDLYDLRVELARAGQVVDQYTLRIGIRTVQVEGQQLLLNGQPVVLKGFGRHVDFPVTGRGYVPAVIVKDYALMEWIGANSFRTSHYPYSEQMLDLADRLGFLVIDETPAVGLFFDEEGLDRRLAQCRQQIARLIDRDRNHPSVIVWSLANEPHTGDRPNARAFFKTLFDDARAADSTRPVTLASYRGVAEDAFDFADLVCINRYYGWYSQPGQLSTALELLSRELDALYDRFRKPVLVTEFGADTIPGHHALPPEMFSEEDQAEFLAGYIQVVNGKPFVAGQHVWNLCDFKTGQAVHRMGGMNYKGVFTRDRRPKLAAHRLRELWREPG